LTEIKVCNLDYIAAHAGSELWAMIATNHNQGKIKQKWIRMSKRTEMLCEWKLRKAAVLSGDIKIEILSREKMGKIAKVLVYICFHAAF